jgi:hypothetical protein
MNISVVLKKPIDVYLDVNETTLVGSTIPVSVRVDNLLEETQSIKVIFKEDTVSAVLSDSKYFVFNFTPKSIDDNLVQVFVSTPDFSTSSSKVINVIGVENALGSFVDLIKGFFRWLLSLFGVSL